LAALKEGKPLPGAKGKAFKPLPKALDDEDLDKIVTEAAEPADESIIFPSFLLLH
jgi:hypothetical protein